MVVALLALPGLAACAEPEATMSELCGTEDPTAVWPLEGDLAPGVGWAQRLGGGPRDYTIYTRPSADGLDPDEGWEPYVRFTLAQDAPRWRELPDLPSGTWEVGVATTTPDC